MAYFPKNKRRVRKGQKVSRRPRRKSVTKKSLVRVIKKQISLGRENKMRQNGGSFFILPTSAVNYQTNCIIPISPYYEVGLSAGQQLDITQGTGVSNRIGNRINTKSAYLRALIFPLPYSVTTNPNPQPLNVTMWIFKMKSGLTDSTGNVLNTLQNNFFKFQNSATGITNTVADFVGTVNPDTVNLLYRKTFKIGYAVDGGTGNNAQFQSYANNEYKYNAHIKMNLTKYIRKNIHYLDGNATPMTATTWMCFTVNYASGASMSNAIQPAQFEFELDYRFEDA